MTSNPYDQASRYAAKMNPGRLLRWLLPECPPNIAFARWLDTRSIPFPGEPDRVCDTVAQLVDSSDPNFHWALPLEFQLAPDGAMFGRLLEYLARLWRELRPPGRSEGRFSVGAAVVNLTGRGEASRTMELRPAGLRLELQIAERNLCDEDAAEVLQAIADGALDNCLLPRIPLMRDGGETDIITIWKQLAESEPDRSLQADFGGLALVFAEAAGCRNQWKQTLARWKVQMSQQVLEWQAAARAEGRNECKAEGKAEVLLGYLRSHFGGKLPKKLVERIHQNTDLTQIIQWLDVAAEASSLADFREKTEL